MDAIRRAFYKLVCLVCVFVLSVSVSIPDVSARGDVWANDFAYTLNDSIVNNGVVSTAKCGDYLGVDTENRIYPNGIVYADLVRFSNDSEPYLVIFRSDNVRGCVSADIYRFNTLKGTSELVSVISKGYNIPDGHTGEIALGHNTNNRYIVFNEYYCGELIAAEYYTVVGSDALRYVNPPQNTGISGVLSYSKYYLHPETDVSYFNKYLSVFFSTLKDGSAKTVEYETILDNITEDEEKKLSQVLNKAAGFGIFDINDYNSMSEYSLSVKEHNGENKFNAITHIYDLGEEIYYIRYSTDASYYNGCLLRRTDALSDSYQILLVRNDFIPLSDGELIALKDGYIKNKLLLKKSNGSMELERKPLIKINKAELPKQISVPQLISPDLRKPIAFIGGGVCLVLFVLLWVFMSSNDEDK